MITFHDLEFDEFMAEYSYKMADGYMVKIGKPPIDAPYLGWDF